MKVPILLSLNLLILVLVGHILSERSIQNTQYISEIKEGEFWLIGYSIFINLIVILLWIAFCFKDWGQRRFSAFYFLAATMAVILMWTPAYSAFHGIIYITMICLITSVFYFYLFFSGYFSEFLLFIGLFIAVSIVGSIHGGAIAQKCFLIYFLAVVLMHYRAIFLGKVP